MWIVAYSKEFGKKKIGRGGGGGHNRAHIRSLTANGFSPITDALYLGDACFGPRSSLSDTFTVRID